MSRHDRIWGWPYGTSRSDRRILAITENAQKLSKFYYYNMTQDEPTYLPPLTPRKLTYNCVEINHQI